MRDYAPSGARRGVPVVCLHGLTRNSKDFEAVAPRIAALGRRVIVPDVRGRGRSDRDAMPERYQPATYVGDLVVVLDALGVDRAAFIGTSMGGLMTMIVAAGAPQRVAAAVLNDIGPVVDPRGLQRIAGYVGKSDAFNSWEDLAASLKAAQSIAFPDADDAFWRISARRVARIRSDGKIEFDYDPAIARALEPPKEGTPSPPPADLMPLFHALVSRPVLVLHGALSDILAGEGVEAMRAAKPDLSVAEIPRVGHAPTLEEPEAWTAISAFLDRLD